MDRTLILVKPDAFARGLTGEIIARFERKGLTIVGAQAHDVDDAAGRAALRRARGQAVLRRARRLHHLRPAAWRWCSRATRRSRAARQVIGATNPLEATTGSIRGDFAHRGRARTWSTAPTPPSRRAREAAVLPRPLGAMDRSCSPRRSPQRRAILEQLGHRRSRCGPPTSTSSTPATRRRSRRERAPQGARRSPGDARSLGARHRRRARRPDLRQAAPTRRRRARRSSAARRPHARGRGRHRGSPRTARSRDRGRGHRASTFRASTGAALDWYVATREWRGRAGGYAIQGRGRRAGRARSRATT